MRLRTWVVILLPLLLLAVPAVLGYRRVERVRAAYERAPPPLPGSQTQGWKEAAEAMADHSNSLTGWVVGLLGWIALVGLTTEIRNIPWRAPILFILFPAAGLLGVSFWAGMIFDGRLAYLKVKEAIGYDDSLNALLGAQRDFFIWAVFPLGLVTLAFFVSLLRERLDASAKGGQSFDPRE